MNRNQTLNYLNWGRMTKKLFNFGKKSILPHYGHFTLTVSDFHRIHKVDCYESIIEYYAKYKK